MSYNILVITTGSESELGRHDALAEEIHDLLGGSRSGLSVRGASAETGPQLQEQLARIEPDLLHWWRDDASKALPVAELLPILEYLEGGPACLVLVGGFSPELADELLEWVPVVIGFEANPGPAANEAFNRAFYRRLGAEQSFRESLDGALEALRLLGMPLPRIVSRSIREESGPGLSRSWIPRSSREATGGAVPDDVLLEGYLGLPSESKGTSMSVGADGSDGTQRSGGLRNYETEETRKEVPAYPLFFGTNRVPLDPRNLSKGFGNERGDLLLGTCQVTVPLSHKIGSTGSSFWHRLITPKDDRLRLDPASLKLLAKEAYWQALREELAGHDTGERDALVFLHGFNVSFEEAALRAAQIGFDLQVPGIMAFYSWPSRGKIAGYTADEATIEASEKHITEFLKTFTRESGAERVHVIAHSMGNRGLLRAMQRILAQAEAAGTKPFGQILLAAPDVDCDLFRELATAYTQIAERTTLYVSAKDRALASSTLFHDGDRAGYTPPMMVIPGIDTVEVTKIDLSMLGHGYMAAAREVLTDMHSLLRHNAAPGKRLGLRHAQTANGATYWVIAD